MIVQQQDVGTILRLRVQALMAAYDRLREENATLVQQVENMKQQLLLKESALDEVGGENDKLHLSRAFLASSADAQEARARVNGIVREIDHCIALLNR